jgi:plasmid stabilization system protein ParE
MRRVVLSRLADAEVTEASEWYDLQALNLGLEFLDQFKKDAQAIAEGPLRWPVFGGSVRRYVMTRFPYLIYYEVEPDLVRILRVVHGSRDPAAVRRGFN